MLLELLCWNWSNSQQILRFSIHFCFVGVSFLWQLDELFGFCAAAVSQQETLQLYIWTGADELDDHCVSCSVDLDPQRDTAHSDSLNQQQEQQEAQQEIHGIHCPQDLGSQEDEAEEEELEDEKQQGDEGEELQQDKDEEPQEDEGEEQQAGLSVSKVVVLGRLRL